MAGRSGIAGESVAVEIVNIVAIIQARMGSSRLPGKMLMPLEMWDLGIKRCKMIKVLVAMQLLVIRQCKMPILEGEVAEM